MARKPARRRMGAKGGGKSTRNTRKSRAQAQARQAELKEAKKIRRAHRRKRKVVVRVLSFGWRLGKGTAVGTAKRVAKYTPMAYNAAADKIAKTYAKQHFPKDYEPEDGEIPDEAWRWRTTYRCCNRRYGTPEALNTHHEREHAHDEAEKAARPMPKIVISTTARSSGKRHVQPVRGTPTGRHRARNKGLTRAEALVEAHRETMTKIGEKAAMTENGAPLKLAQGFKQLEEGPLGGFTAIENLALGMEQALAAGASAYDAYRLKMIQAGFDPMHLHQLVLIKQDLDSAAKRSSSFIATLVQEYGPEIKAAKERLKGERPNDKLLTS